MDQGAGIGVFQHPQRAIGPLFHIADAFAHIPALGGFRAAVAVKDDAVERHGRHAADEAAAIPLRENLSAVVEHQIAGRDHRHPIEHRLRQVGPRVGLGNGHAVVVLTIGHERPAVILALLDQVQFVPAGRAMLDLP